MLVDKPVTPTSAEAKELGSLAVQKGLILYAFQNRRWDSEFQALRRLLKEPPSSSLSLGEIFEFETQCVTEILFVICVVDNDTYFYLSAMTGIAHFCAEAGKKMPHLELD